MIFGNVFYRNVNVKKATRLHFTTSTTDILQLCENHTHIIFSFSSPAQ